MIYSVEKQPIIKKLSILYIQIQPIYQLGTDTNPNMIFHTEKNNLSIPDNSQNIINSAEKLEKRPIYQFSTQTQTLPVSIPYRNSQFINSIQKQKIYHIQYIPEVPHQK